MEKYFRIASTISRWKINSALEKLLANIADNCEIGKRLYIFYYSIFDRAYHINGRKYIKKELERQRHHRKDFSDISESALTRDMEYCLHRYGVSFEEYFIYRFYDLNKYGRRKFNSLKMQYGYCEQFNSPSIAKICEDKYETYKLFRKYYKRDIILYDIHEKGNDKTLSFLKKYKKMIFKPLRGHSGQGIQLLQSDALNSEDLNRLFEKFGPFLLEELIIQGSEMSILHPSSINTIRLATVKTSEGSKVYGCALRMGRGGNAVDNAGAGGIYATVDLEHGVVVSRGIDNVGNEYVCHPDSNVIIPGFKLPDWDNVKLLIDELSTVIPDAGLIAWDLAYSHNGWCLVEANDIGEQYLFQAPIKEGVKPQLLSLLDSAIKLN